MFDVYIAITYQDCIYIEFGSEAFVFFYMLYQHLPIFQHVAFSFLNHLKNMDYIDI